MGFLRFECLFSTLISETRNISERCKKNEMTWLKDCSRPDVKSVCIREMRSTDISSAITIEAFHEQYFKTKGRFLEDRIIPAHNFSEGKTMRIPEQN